MIEAATGNAVKLKCLLLARQHSYEILILYFPERKRYGLLLNYTKMDGLKVGDEITSN